MINRLPKNLPPLKVRNKIDPKKVCKYPGCGARGHYMLALISPDGGKLHFGSVWFCEQHKEPSVELDDEVWVATVHMYERLGKSMPDKSQFYFKTFKK